MTAIITRKRLNPPKSCRQRLRNKHMSASLHLVQIGKNSLLAISGEIGSEKNSFSVKENEIVNEGE